MNYEKAKKYISQVWDQSIIPILMEYIQIPNKSPMFDGNWQKNGYMDKAIRLFKDWSLSQSTEDMKIEILQLEGRTPLLYIDVPSDSDKTVLLYGHMDKQPETTGWEHGLGPWLPVLKKDKLYGRGGADDGYALFAALTAINLLKKQSQKYPHCVIIIEACEESGSYDLPFYLEIIKSRFNAPGLVICLDSSCGNYDQLWVTTSLRGVVVGNLDVQILREGIHSGLASGIVPSSFRIVRSLLDRIENSVTGEVLIESAKVDIPIKRLQEAEQTAQILGENIYKTIPFITGSEPVSKNLTDLLINRSWKAALSMIGASGIPSCEEAGSVQRSYTKLKLSLRIPPNCDPLKVATQFKNILERDPPYNAKVTFELVSYASGWEAPETSKWLREITEQSSRIFFGQGACYIGEGGTIPFMAMLGKQFPEAQFLITGVLGPNSNAHGPNEFLHLPTAKNLTGVVAEILQNYYHQSS